ncbi:hypothetical protein [Paenibacillus hexagrammi]|uniref:Uncharacterized protein n=1 Tax=Paenibacillus hexagrammi TaxID=2908839 RepID=A0ABY3SKK6_9BACL|nr:hypothetical protein [Paenibacillus sp. YPD9-1]UJF34583.1 hypothetical protein L0M14_05240 [Paenibacillus sp. YPD9-1]
MLSYGNSLQSRILLFILLFLGICPIINVGGFDAPILYLFIPLSLFVFLFILFKWIKVPFVIWIIMLFFILIMIEIVLSTYIGTITAFNEIMIPTDVIQYLARFLCILSYFVLIAKSKIDTSTFIRFFLIILILAMSVGILQWIPWGGQTLFINLYKFRDGSEQLAQLDRYISLRRVHGVAQMATANGGIAAFCFIFAYSVFGFFKKYKLLSLILMLFSLVNIVASQSRAGMLMLAFSIFTFYFVKIIIYRKGFKSTAMLLIGVSLIYLFGDSLYNSGNPFMVQLIYRWRVLFDDSGGVRMDQINFGLSLLSNAYQYIFGISRAFQNYSGLVFYLEIEPIDILVLYGALGFVLQYSLVIYLLVYFFKNFRWAITRPEILSLLIASFVGLLSYQVFSVGYFFFREIRIGLIPWILMGTAIGFFEKSKQECDSKSNISLH